MRGGIGKTATAHAFGDLYRQAGRRVLYVDLDAQSNLTEETHTPAAEPGQGSAGILAGTCTGSGALVTLADGCGILPGSEQLAAIMPGDPHSLARALDTLAGAFDLAIIDSPPAFSAVTAAGLMAAGAVIVPALAERHSLASLAKLATHLRAAQAAGSRARFAGVIICRQPQPETILSRQMREQLTGAASVMGGRLLGTVRQCAAVPEAQAIGEAVTAYAPKSTAAQDLRDAWQLYEQTAKGAE